MSFSLKDSVGAGCKNHKADVEAVQTQLNKYIHAQMLGTLELLPVNGKASSNGATVKAIKEFQKRICGMNSPDGKISKDGTTSQKLANDPHLTPLQAAILGYALKSLAFGAPPGIPADLWSRALKSLLFHSGDARLLRGHLLTLIDFRKVNTEQRLWLVDIKSGLELRKELVGHGKGSALKGAPAWSKHFSNEPASNASCVGAFVALTTWPSQLGGQSGTALAVDGLDKSNSAARSRGIRFHGATYVKPSSVGNSHGCFVTMSSVNEPLVKVISGGSFVYALGGDDPAA
jgi:hypothetical protein